MQHEIHALTGSGYHVYVFRLHVYDLAGSSAQFPRNLIRRKRKSCIEQSGRDRKHSGDFERAD